MFSLVLWKTYNQILLAHKARFPGDSQSLCIPRLGSLRWGSKLTIMWELLWYYCSPLCGSPTWQVWDLIWSWLHPSYHLTRNSLFLDMGYLLLVSSSILLLMVVQPLVAILVLSSLVEEMSAYPSTPPSSTHTFACLFQTTPNLLLPGIVQGSACL